MCSICGGTRYDTRLSDFIWKKSSDRGRDDHGKILKGSSWIGNHRAVPTTETETPTEKQPVGNNPWVVFNGIVSNDKELGLKEGEVDTSILPRILDFTSLERFRNSIEEKLIGSYAIAVLFEDGVIWLACNYKPIWYYILFSGDIYFSSLKQHFPEHTNPIRMDPYSVMDLSTRQTLPIRRVQKEKALVICSGGLDSTTAASVACKEHGADFVTLLHFDYGCKATSKEIESIKKIAVALKCDYKILKMPSFGGSSLLEEEDHIVSGVKGAEFAHEWVPARNLVMLSLATAFAEAHNYGHIYLGTNLEEAGAYPDNEEQFILDFNNLLYGAVQNGVKIQVHTPLGGLMKHEIVALGTRLGTPFEHTWSCYRAGEHHCGECGPCFMRHTAFKRNNLIDPVLYDNKK